jgi:hypothetical protein
LGYAAAISQMGTVAAPLLAATSGALLGLLLTSPEHFRWTGAASATLIVAVLSFVAAIELTFWAKRFDVTREQMLAWWDDASHQPRLELLAAEQEHHARRFAAWAARAGDAYDAGIVALLASITLMLVPEGEIEPGRIAAIVLAVLGAVAELTWIGFVRRRPGRFDRPSYNEPERGA